MKKNLISLLGWCLREIKKTIVIFNQTLLGPFFENFIMFIVFRAFLQQRENFDSTLLDGLFGGILSVTVIKGSFSNGNSRIVLSKMVGYVNDYIALPFARTNMLISVCVGGIVRSVVISLLFCLCIPIFNIHLVHPFWLLFIICLVSIFFSLLGLAFGVKFDTMEQVYSASSYLITPFSMLSGAFFPISSLPLFLRKISLFNPFFYATDIFKYCFTDSLFFSLHAEIMIFSIALFLVGIVAFCLVSNFIEGSDR